MNPIDFPETNTTFGPPAGMTESQVQPVPAYCGQVRGGSCDGVEAVVVAWRPTREEIEQIAAGSPIYLTMIGGLPPHFLTTSFEEATKVA
jgi:hypothetical protein